MRPKGNIPRATGDALQATVRDAIDGLLVLPDGHPTIVSVATELAVNVRTLQRRLQRAGVPFRDLLAQSRRRWAIQELRRGGLSVGEVAAALGYSDPAHFARAFRRWTGRTPTSYLRGARSTSRSPAG